MSETSVRTADDYGSVLAEFVQDASETALLAAYDLGRKAMEEGVGVLGLTTVYHEALLDILASKGGSASRRTVLERAGQFFSESLAPFEMAHRGFHEANEALRKVTTSLEEQVAERTRRLEQSLEALRKSDDERRRLMSRLITVQEEERQRIAGDIHDDSVQVMTAVAIRLGLLRRRLSGEDYGTLLESLEETVTLSVERLRHLLFELRPPALDREGLSAAVRLYLEEAMEDTGFTYRVEDRLDFEPSPETRVIVYRIAQEALANVRKHSAASRVEVLLESSHGGVLTRVRDDGVGFVPAEEEPQPGHLGLSAMRERAEMAGGWCKVDSGPGAGTEVEFWVPLGDERDD